MMAYHQSMNQLISYLQRCSQRLCLGSFIIFFVYNPPLVIGKHKGVKFHYYADDTQVYIHLSQKNSSAAFEKLNRCLDEWEWKWMSASKLKLNSDKTEFIVFCSKRQRDKLKAYFPSTILGSPLCTAESVKNLGVWFNSDFSLSKHVQNVCKVVLCNSVILDMSGGFLCGCSTTRLRLPIKGF